MRYFNGIVAILAILFLGIFSPAYAKDINDIDWTDPDSIDPYMEGIGEFLDLDLSEAESLAWETYMAGDYETAAKYYLALLRFNITNGSSIYNLACCYGLLGEEELAAEFVVRAYNAGFTDLDHIGWDPDFDLVRDSDVFSEAYDELVEQASSEEAERGELIYLDAEGFFECRVMLPDDYDPVRAYTLIVGLHGFGSNIDRFVTLYDKFKNHDFIYATPRAPYPFNTGGGLGYSWDKWDPMNEDFWAMSTEATIAYVAGAVEQLGNRYNVDDVYLMGFSQGCALTYLAGLSHHELFDGLICFGGWLNTDYLGDDVIAAGNDTRVFIGHGVDDNMVEFEAGEVSRDTLLDLGFDVTFYDFVGGHRVPEEMVWAVERWMKAGEVEVYF